jgi:hypothetical protein
MISRVDLNYSGNLKIIVATIHNHILYFIFDVILFC